MVEIKYVKGEFFLSGTECGKPHGWHKNNTQQKQGGMKNLRRLSSCKEEN